MSYHISIITTIATPITILVTRTMINLIILIIAIIITMMINDDDHHHITIVIVTWTLAIAAPLTQQRFALSPW